MSNPVNWFEIVVTDLERAKKFYSAVFGYTFGEDIPTPDDSGSKMAFLPADMEGPGASGSLYYDASGQMKPSAEGVCIYISHNPDLQEALDKVEAAGGQIINPKMSIGEFGAIGHFMDTEGNVIGVHNAPSEMGSGA